MPPLLEEPCSSYNTLEIAPPTGTGGWLVEVQDEAGARPISLSIAEGVVGASVSPDIVVHHATVSAPHPALSILAAGGVVHDLGAKNSTYLGCGRLLHAR